jgi:hypothetical protein
MRISHCLRWGAGVPARPCGASFFGGVLRLVRLVTPSGRTFNATRRNINTLGLKVNAWQRTFNARGGRTFNATRRNIDTPGRKVNAWQRTFNACSRLPLPLIDLGRGGGRPDWINVGIIGNVAGSYRV